VFQVSPNLLRIGVRAAEPPILCSRSPGVARRALVLGQRFVAGPCGKRSRLPEGDWDRTTAAQMATESEGEQRVGAWNWPPEAGVLRCLRPCGADRPCPARQRRCCSPAIGRGGALHQANWCRRRMAPLRARSRRPAWPLRTPRSGSAAAEARRLAGPEAREFRGQDTQLLGRHTN
jgi:hypothetical protein